MNAWKILRGLAAMLLGTTLLGQAISTSVIANTVTSAQFSQQDSSNDPNFTNNGSTVTFQ